MREKLPNILVAYSNVIFKSGLCQELMAILPRERCSSEGCGDFTEFGKGDMLRMTRAEAKCHRGCEVG